jgi:hypothetical protein
MSGHLDRIGYVPATDDADQRGQYRSGARFALSDAGASVSRPILSAIVRSGRLVDLSPDASPHAKPEAVSRRISVAGTRGLSRPSNHQLPLAEWRGSTPTSG